MLLLLGDLWMDVAKHQYSYNHAQRLHHTICTTLTHPIVRRCPLWNRASTVAAIIVQSWTEIGCGIMFPFCVNFSGHGRILLRAARVQASLVKNKSVKTKEQQNSTPRRKNDYSKSIWGTPRPPCPAPTPGKTVPRHPLGDGLPNDGPPTPLGGLHYQRTHTHKNCPAKRKNTMAGLSCLHAHKRCGDMHHPALNIQQPAPKQVPLWSE